MDRSIENPQLFLVTNILGTQNLLDAARRAWVTGKDEAGYPQWREGVRFHQVSTDEVYGSLGAEGYFHENDSAGSEKSVQRLQNKCRFICKKRISILIKCR